MSDEKNKKVMKKKLIVIFFIISAALLVMYALTMILPLLSKNISYQDEEGTANFNFYEPDFEENIFEDEEYMALISDGVVRYDNSSNSVVNITLENADEHGDTVKLLVDFVYSIIDGDCERYNSFFSEEYLESNGKKENFTMQKIYNCMITYFSQEDVSENGNNYTKYIYKLKYQIYENNGTYRQDIGEDYKTQYIVITDRNGKLLIDAVTTSNYK